MPDLVLYQPEIPGNAGTLLRLGACLGTTVHIIEPAGFRLDEKAFRRAGMDYLDQASLQRHLSWDTFETWRAEKNRRLVLLTTSGDTPYTRFAYERQDLLMLGRETSGVPENVHSTADARVVIKMREGARSINMALAGAMVLGEALRQTG